VAFAIEPTPGATYRDAEHIVILMQEDRAFDHALGSLQGGRGFNDPRAIRQANGNSVFLQTNAAGATYAPWRLDLKITWMGSIPLS
jgi:phospholipase C